MQKKEMIQRLLRCWWMKKDEDGYITKRQIQSTFQSQRYYKQKPTPDRIVKYEELMIQVFKFLEENWEILPRINRKVPALYRPKSWNRITGILSKQELRKMKDENEQVRESFGLSKVMVGKILRNHYTRKQIMKKNPHFKEGYLPLGFYKKNRVRQIKVTGKGRGGMITLFYAPDVDKFKPQKSGQSKLKREPNANWINIHQAVEIAPVTMGTIYHAAKIGKIQSKKVGRNRLFLKQSVELYEKNRNHNLSVPHPTYERKVQPEPQEDREKGPLTQYKNKPKLNYDEIKKAYKDMLNSTESWKYPDPPKKETKGDDVNHPDYYNDGKFEVIDVIEDWSLDFNAGNVIKYVARAKLKHTSKAEQKKDLQKALWYIQRMLDKL